ncbi:MAG: hypothetical protein ACJA0H_000465 [Francisellaceae bacterium]|jgi:hypothetical protein
MVNIIMVDITLLKECGLDSWRLRDESVFSEFIFVEHQKYNLLEQSSFLNPYDAIILLKQNVKNHQLLTNFCQAMFGLDSTFLFLYKSVSGDDINSLLTQANVNKIISFVDIQKDTLSFDQNVLIFNDIDFELLGHNKQYKKQVMLDVNRVSVSSIRN